MQEFTFVIETRTETLRLSATHALVLDGAITLYRGILHTHHFAADVWTALACAEPGRIEIRDR